MDRLLKINEIFWNIRRAIEEKGVVIGECEGPETYAEKILKIGADVPIEPPIDDPDIPDPDVPVEPDEPIVPDPIVPEIKPEKDEIKIESNSELKYPITIKYENYDSVKPPQIIYKTENVDWIRISEPTVNGDEYTYVVVVGSNKTDIRDAEIVFSCIKNDEIISEIVNVKQDAFIETSKIALEEGKSEYSVTDDESNLIIPVSYYNSEKINIPSHPNWISCEISSYSNKDGKRINNYLIQIEKNDSEERIGIITFSCIGVDGVSHSIDCTITQANHEVEIPTEELSISCDTYNLNFSHKYFEASVIVVPKNGSITYSTDAGWFYIKDEGNNVYSIIGFDNTSGKNRSGKAIFTCSDGINEVKHYINISQSYEQSGVEDLYIKTDAAFSAIDYEKCTVVRNISTNTTNWRIKTALPNWISAEIDYSKNTITLTIERNDSVVNDRTAKIYIEGEKNGNHASCVMEIVQWKRNPILADILSTDYLIEIPAEGKERWFVVSTKNTIDTEHPYEIWVKSKPDWVEIKFLNSQKEDWLSKQLVAVVEPNGGPERSGNVVFACMSEDNIESTCTVQIVQDGAIEW